MEEPFLDNTYDLRLSHVPMHLSILEEILDTKSDLGLLHGKP